jgi:MinD superfamily P-loop ATPase
MEIAIISGKGGTGKSSITAAFATMLSNVVVADCDVDAANLYLLFNPDIETEETFVGSQSAVIDYSICTNCAKCVTYCRFDAISIVKAKVKINEVFCDGCHLCKRVCPVKAISMLDSANSRLYSGNFRNGKMVYGVLAPGEENTGKLVNLVRNKAKEIAAISGISDIIIDGPPGIGCPVISTIAGVDKLVVVTETKLVGLARFEEGCQVIG